MKASKNQIKKEGKENNMKNSSNRVFGYTDIRSNSINSLHNDYHNESDLRRELQGKEISIQTIESAAKKVSFSKFSSRGDVKIHSFFPDKGRAFLGAGGHADVVISWDVPNENGERLNDVLAQLKELKDIVSQILEK